MLESSVSFEYPAVVGSENVLQSGSCPSQNEFEINVLS